MDTITSGARPEKLDSSPLDSWPRARGLLATERTRPRLLVRG